MMERSSNERADEIKERIAGIRRRMKVAAQKAGRKEDEIILEAVTKTMPVSDINCAISNGIKVIGENRCQELTAKIPGMQRCERHFIGQLQSNKIRQMIDKVDMFESVGVPGHILELNRQAEKRQQPVNILVEVNIGRETSKSGVLPEFLEELLIKASKCTYIRVRGLMAIPPFSRNPEESRPFFSKMRELLIDNKAKKMDNVYMDYLSMGMSNDFEIAIQEGANIVRIGSAIFGTRNYS